MSVAPTSSEKKQHAVDNATNPNAAANVVQPSDLKAQAESGAMQDELGATYEADTRRRRSPSDAALYAQKAQAHPAEWQALVGAAQVHGKSLGASGAAKGNYERALYDFGQAAGLNEQQVANLNNLLADRLIREHEHDERKSTQSVLASRADAATLRKNRERDQYRSDLEDADKRMKETGSKSEVVQQPQAVKEAKGDNHECEGKDGKGSSGQDGMPVVGTPPAKAMDQKMAQQEMDRINEDNNKLGKDLNDMTRDGEPSAKDKRRRAAQGAQAGQPGQPGLPETGQVQDPGVVSIPGGDQPPPRTPGGGGGGSGM